MTINTKLRLTILASALALVAVAPVASAQESGTWYGDMHTDPVTAEGIVTRHSRALMEQKVATPAPIAQDTGTWYGDMHTDPVTAEGTITRHSRKLMEMKIVPSTEAGSQVDNSIQLRDGSTVHVFADGKMAMENGFGRAAYMEPGHVMETNDGKQIVMKGNEVARLDALIIRSRVGG